MYRFARATCRATQLTALDTAYRTGNDSTDYLNYLRGERLHEQASTATGSSKAYRTRTGLLGDVVGSKARPVGPPSLPLSNASNPGYGAFKSTWASRPTVVYVGANDGVLHAVNGALTGTDAGREMFAYVPSSLFAGPTGTPGTNGLAALGNPSFVHHYYVNATPGVFDIDFNRTHGASGAANWRSVLIGGLGKGGRSYYALDVTNPAGMTTEALAAAKVLWEFTDADMGYTYGEPTVVKTRKYGWVVILPSGYNNTDGKGYFFIVNPRTGALLEKIGTGAGAGDLAHGPVPSCSTAPTASPTLPMPATCWATSGAWTSRPAAAATRHRQARAADRRLRRAPAGDVASADHSAAAHQQALRHGRHRPTAAHQRQRQHAGAALLRHRRRQRRALQQAGRPAVGHQLPDTSAAT